MTNEEAIEAIKCNWPDSRYTILREALDMAISALRQQEQAFECTQYEECEYNGNPVCNLPAKEKCPHGLKRNDGKNKPLTLDELRRMEGQPVYIVENTEYWAIVNSFDQAGVYLLSYGNPDDYGYFGLYGKTWLAYRQKPEEDDHDERKENENV